MCCRSTVQSFSRQILPTEECAALSTPWRRRKYIGNRNSPRASLNYRNKMSSTHSNVNIYKLTLLIKSKLYIFLQTRQIYLQDSIQRMNLHQRPVRVRCDTSQLKIITIKRLYFCPFFTLETNVTVVVRLYPDIIKLYQEKTEGWHWSLTHTPTSYRRAQSETILRDFWRLSTRLQNSLHCLKRLDGSECRKSFCKSYFDHNQ